MFPGDREHVPQAYLLDRTDHGIGANHSFIVPPAASNSTILSMRRSLARVEDSSLSTAVFTGKAGDTESRYDQSAMKPVSIDGRYVDVEKLKKVFADKFRRQISFQVCHGVLVALSEMS